MPAKFTIKKYGPQKRSENFDNILPDEVLADIVYKITGKKEFVVSWLEEKNKGRLLLLESADKSFYICVSPNGRIGGRNSSIQSVSTALNSYSNINTDKKDFKEDSNFYYYFLEHDGNLQTPYLNFIYCLMKTIGIKFIINDKSINEAEIKSFSTPEEIIVERNRIGGTNSGNNSSYIDKQKDFYEVYLKTFGANEKEAVLMCLALMVVSDKPIFVYQVEDNSSTKISSKDKNMLNSFMAAEGFSDLHVFDSHGTLNKNQKIQKEDSSEETLRDPRFNYNLFKKSSGIKKCALCSCEISESIQAAHIFPVSQIKKLNGLSYEQKLKLAIDGDNGIWLCQNHHSIFDADYYSFGDKAIEYQKNVNDVDKTYIEKITTSYVDKDFFNERTKMYLELRKDPTKVELIMALLDSFSEE